MCCATARRGEAGDQTCPDGTAWLRVRQLGGSRGRTYCQRHVRPSSEALFAVSWNWLLPNEGNNTRLSFRAERAARRRGIAIIPIEGTGIGVRPTADADCGGALARTQMTQQQQTAFQGVRALAF